MSTHTHTVAVLAEFYERRAAFLKTLTLETTLSAVYHDFFLIRVACGDSAPAIIRRLMTTCVEDAAQVTLNQMRLAEPASEGTPAWRAVTPQTLTLQVNEASLAKQRQDCAAEWAAAENRLVGKFVPLFCHADGSINWEKLVAFNSGSA